MPVKSWYSSRWWYDLKRRRVYEANIAAVKAILLKVLIWVCFKLCHIWCGTYRMIMRKKKGKWKKREKTIISIYCLLFYRCPLFSNFIFFDFCSSTKYKKTKKKKSRHASLEQRTIHVEPFDNNILLKSWCKNNLTSTPTSIVLSSCPRFHQRILREAAFLVAQAI